MVKWRKGNLAEMPQPSDFDRLKPIHIAGTKGKGSTAAFVSSILAHYQPQHGLQDSSVESETPVRKIGLYTSPHLRSVRERIQINNDPISEEQFAQYFFELWDRLEDAALKAGNPTDVSAKPVYFRFLTLMALHTYMSEGVDTAVIECGIGGEYDTTNILTLPSVSGITSLGIDHVAILGETIEEIAWHKAGIFKHGSPAFTVSQPPAAMEVLRKRAVQKAVHLTHVPRLSNVRSTRLGLAADFQEINASLAVALAGASLNIPIPKIRQDGPVGKSVDPLWPFPCAFKTGLEKVRWPGRCDERHDKNITWYIDGGHTLDSIEVGASWFAKRLSVWPEQVQHRSRTSDYNQHADTKTPNTKVLIFNQQTRDASELARALHLSLAATLKEQSHFTHAIFCTNVTFRDQGYKADLASMNNDQKSIQELSVQKELAVTWAKIDPDTNVFVLSSIQEAVGQVRKLAENQEDDIMVFVTGSLHLVGGILEILETDKVEWQGRTGP